MKRQDNNPHPSPIIHPFIHQTSIPSSIKHPPSSIYIIIHQTSSIIHLITFHSASAPLNSFSSKRLAVSWKKLKFAGKKEVTE